MKDVPVIVNGIEIDVEKANIIMRRILILEKRNMQSQDLNHSTVIREIVKIIEEEVKCY